MNSLQINQRVTRINSGNDSGRKGLIVEIDATAQRARVLWDHSGIRTWIKFSCLVTS